ncbi:MAG TPA: hypothetical protein VEC11_07390 [Allosphingosinicella sp.]|nr:hypothetical protein [Allosphingosinicella sp.]
MPELIAKPEAADRRLGAALRAAAALILLSAGVMFVLFRHGGFTVDLFRQDDLPALIPAGALLLALAVRPLALPGLRLGRPAMLLLALALAVLALAFAGTWLIFGDFAVTRDEILADFDAAFISRGMLIAPVPPEWQAFAGALMPDFMLPIPSQAGWLSAYLPGNAALRALASLTVGEEWTNPILAAVSVLAVYRIGRRLWPETPGPALVAALLMASSAQFLTMAMTPYAMSAHLAFNLLWLWSFLREDWKGDVGALAAGFVATGLHQLLFHPLFVLPFVARMWWTGQRRRCAVYLLAYAMIGLFWACYWQLLLAGSTAMGGQAGASGLPYLLARLADLLGSIQPSAIALTGFNLLRALSWQNVVLLPFLILAWRAVRRGEGIARPLAAGLLLTIAAMMLLLPWQGLGWGYRYVHGLIGSLVLLAGYGWNTLVAEGRRREFVLAAGSAMSLLLILPMHLQHAAEYVAPMRRAYAMIARSPADVVLVDWPWGMANDLVRNAPDLSNRPKILAGNRLNAAQVRDLCRRYRVEIFDVRHGQRAGLPPALPEGAQAPPSAVQAARCGTPLPLGD